QASDFVATWLERHPEAERAGLLELANQATEAASDRYGRSPELALAAMRWAETAQAQRTQGVDAFVHAVGQAAKGIGVDPQAVDVAKVYEAATRAHSDVAAALPGAPADEIALRAIIGALRAQHGTRGAARANTTAPRPAAASRPTRLTSGTSAPR